MGRYSTGITTTGQAKRIELSYLISKGYIKKGCSVSGTLYWTDKSSIGINSYYLENESYIELNYTNTVYATNEKTDYKYRIQLEAIPSNLEKGNVLYFICPESGKRCRILYKCYGSEIWKSRESYKNRIYYESQIEPKSIRPYKHLFIDNKLSALYQKAKKSHYRGKPTKLMQRIDKLNKLSDAAMVNYGSFEKLLSGIK